MWGNLCGSKKRNGVCKVAKPNLNWVYSIGLRISGSSKYVHLDVEMPLLVIALIITLVLAAASLKRLLEFKRQLNNPQHHIHFNHAGVLVLKTPTLQLEDLELLTGIFPTMVNGNNVRYEFNRPEAPEHSLVYVLEFENRN